MIARLTMDVQVPNLLKHVVLVKLYAIHQKKLTYDVTLSYDVTKISTLSQSIFQ